MENEKRAVPEQSSNQLVDCGRTAAETSDSSTAIPLFTKCRNERLRLPAFLRHYRALGVSRFFVVDNASTDGSHEYLLEQPDVHVFRTEASFRQARGGTAWLNELLERFAHGRWCVTVDVDELLYFSGSETRSLADFTRHLDETGSEALQCLLLDMYPEGPLGRCAYAAGDDLVAAAPWFDPSPYYALPWHECPGVLFYGGVRERVFYPDSYARTLRRRLHVGLYHRVLPRFPALAERPFLASRRPLIPPCLTKVPLVRWSPGTRYLNVNHFVSPRRLAVETGVLLHFKFLQDFDERARAAIARAEYYDGAVEYRRYSEKLARDPRMVLGHADSVRFEDTTQLERLGLMRDTPAWSSWRPAIERGSER